MNLREHRKRTHEECVANTMIALLVSELKRADPEALKRVLRSAEAHRLKHERERLGDLFER